MMIFINSKNKIAIINPKLDSNQLNWLKNNKLNSELMSVLKFDYYSIYNKKLALDFKFYRNISLHITDS